MKNAYTIVEILVGLMILVILAAIVVPQVIVSCKENGRIRTVSPPKPATSPAVQTEKN